MELVSTSLEIFDCFMKEYRDRLNVQEVESPVKVPDY